MQKCNSVHEQAGPDDLLMTVEQLRMIMRDAVNLRQQPPLIEARYIQIRLSLLGAEATRSILPDWLHSGATLGDAVYKIRQDARRYPNSIRFRKFIEVSLKPLLDSLQSQAVIQGSQIADLVSRRIQLRVNKYFGAVITVEARAIQVLSMAPQDNAQYLKTIWRNIIMYYPAIAAMLEQMLPQNVDYADLVHYLSIGTELKGLDCVSDKFIWPVLDRCFRDFRTHQLTQYATQMQRSRTLSAVDLLVGSMKAPIRSVYDLPLVSVALRKNRNQFSGSASHWKYAASLIENLSNSFARLSTADPSCGDQQFALIPDGQKLRLVPFGTWKYCRSPDESIGPEQIYRGNAIQSKSFFSDDSLAELENLINTNALEREFQRFFEIHHEYLLALGPYSNILPQVVLTEDTGNRLIPDFFLENFHSGFCDICDLKRPSELLIKTNRGRPQFRDSVMAAVEQIRDYRNYFEDSANRKRFEATYKGLRAFRPQVILVIGRRETFYEELDRIRLASELRDSITLHSYDDVLASARRWRTLTRGLGSPISRPLSISIPSP